MDDSHILSGHPNTLQLQAEVQPHPAMVPGRATQSELDVFISIPLTDTCALKNANPHWRPCLRQLQQIASPGFSCLG